MPDLNVRDFIIEKIRPLLPSDWRFVNHANVFERQERPVVAVGLERFVRNPAAPNGARLAFFTITLTEPSDNVASLDDYLGERVIDLANAIDDIQEIQFLEANRVRIGEADPGYYGFDISVAVSVSTDKDL
jgi:hypothetical protein